MQRAKPGQVLCSEQVATVAAHESLAATRPLGAVRLKNIVQPVPLYELLLDDAPSSITFIDPVCRMQVEQGGAVERPYQGFVMHFCSGDCARRFFEQPDLYLQPTEMRFAQRAGTGVHARELSLRQATEHGGPRV